MHRGYSNGTVVGVLDEDDRTHFVGRMSNINTTKAQTPPYNKSDYRPATVFANARKDPRSLRTMGRSFHVNYYEQPSGRNCVTVDTSNARNSLDVLRMCLRDLKWREVRSENTDFVA